ncbi:hypothetical protein AQUCO_01400833v1 [Aquilegia coerulea]|uniref:Uncharacterized protein n=1 Tax=Aquilegia coerulea TaxID=218851 RepID=A0A2G5DZ14_AQUCA|nr:hypothetical protein AQUCO_01400833v1 [Aquilegia coerulea]
MEPANIDWNNIESIFVVDELYENINAPKWVDFSAPDDYVDDEAWFCKPECRHPKTVEDFRKSSFVSKVKHFRSQTLSSLSENFPLRDRNLRDENMKNRKWNKSKTCNSSSDRLQEDQENENPNNSETTPSKTEKRKPFEERKSPKLKSIPSSSNLFAGRDILNQITDFCSELKKMVLKSKEESEISKKLSTKSDETKSLLEKESSGNVLKEIDRENKPLLEVKKGISETVDTSNENKPRKLNEKENSPITMDVKMIKHAQEEKLLQVRTNPPSPQCFSAYREPLRRAKPTTPLKPSKTIRAVDKGVLQEVEQNNRVDREPPSTPQNISVDKATPQNISVAGKEARTMEMFWILKPCLAK